MSRHLLFEGREATGDGGSDPTTDGYVQVKATYYGTGGVFVQVDVTDPDEGPSYSDTADIDVWVGQGHTPPTTPPASSYHAAQSSPGHDLNIRRWGSGSTVWIDSSTTHVWVFVKVENHHNTGTGSGDFYHNDVFALSDIMVDWREANEL